MFERHRGLVLGITTVIVLWSVIQTLLPAALVATAVWFAIRYVAKG